ncbi:hypothetical protein CIRMBP1287_01727 [Enterococcus cecorum]|uniref:hypothetical protein n=1 Tax=Enterococcus cecorum TaxID=44008 RepID=UPI00248F5037|nr:hypothetical protein [Enterococcus cecorum]CAI3519719.1 hypothetical protein CIRMBP1287_01727 [Enterococcus cecorum]
MELNQSVITNKGRTLMAKLLSGRATATFTKMVLSSTVYQLNQLAGLTTISGVRQTSLVQAKPNNAATVSVESAFNNEGLTSGYDINTIGIYATDPDEGEVLYAVATAKQNGYMPADNGVSKSGINISFYTEVGDPSKVSIVVPPEGVATKMDIQQVRAEIEDLQGFVGYNDADVYGVEVDMINKTFKRLAGAVNRTPGTGFDTINAFGGRKRCILTNEGKVVAYYGETGYTETGALLQQVQRGADTFPVGTKVQVMVEQPLFYYKVSPIELEPIADGKGYHHRKGRYYVSDKPKAGFKIHPAFIVNGAVRDKIYLSAYEGSLYDVSANAYILNDEQVADFNNDMLSSIAGAKPISGLTQDLTRGNVRKLAQKRGTGWQQAYAATFAATQLLFLVEYAKFNMQDVLGPGATGKTDDSTSNLAEPTGATTTLGNQSGHVTNGSNIQIVSYRGEENLYGNIWKFIDGINVMANGIHAAYVADHDFNDKQSTGSYTDVGFTLAKTSGYVSAFGYSQEFDWLFLTSETTGNSSVPVGDYFWQNYTATDDGGWRTVRLGAHWNYGSSAGGFHWFVRSPSVYRGRTLSGRLVYAA